MESAIESSPHSPIQMSIPNKFLSAKKKKKGNALSLCSTKYLYFSKALALLDLEHSGTYYTSAQQILIYKNLITALLLFFYFRFSKSVPPAHPGTHDLVTSHASSRKFSQNLSRWTLSLLKGIAKCCQMFISLF